MQVKSLNSLIESYAKDGFLRAVITPEGIVEPIAPNIFPISDFKTVEAVIGRLIPKHDPEVVTMWAPVRLNRRYTMWVDDDGYYRQLPFNKQATALCFEAGRTELAITGTVFVILTGDVL